MATSSDGTLTATADATGGGIMLRANYASPWGYLDTFDTNISGWTNNFSATLSRTTTSPITGTGGMLWIRDSASSAANRTVTALPSKPYMQKVVIYFNAKMSFTGPGTYVTIDWAGTATGHVEVGIVTVTARSYFATFYIAANTTPSTTIIFGCEPTNSSGTLNSGNLVLDDVHIEVQPPIGVNLYRDGTPVRGCTPSPAAGGIAYGYDYQAVNGAQATYTAEPVYSVKNTEITGPMGSGANITVPDIGINAVWLKSVSNPNLSQKVIGKWPAPARTWTSRNNLTANPGSQYSSGSWDVPVKAAESWVLETTTVAEGLALEELLVSGPMLLQHSVTRNRPDMYAVIDSIECTYKLGPTKPELLWTVAFVPISQPPSDGAPLVIPNRSYDALQAAYGLYSTVASSLTSYDQWLVVSAPVTEPPVTAGFGTSPFGLIPFGY